MLEALGLRVNFIPRIVKNIVEEPFQKSMVTHYFQSAMPSRLCQHHSVMFA